MPVNPRPHHESPDGSDTDPFSRRSFLLRATAGGLAASVVVATRAEFRPALAQQDDPQISIEDWRADDHQDETSAASWDTFRTIVAANSPTAVGVHWPNAVGSWPHVEIQISHDGVEWSAVFVLHVDGDAGRETIEGRYFTPLLHCDGQRYIAYRIVDEQGAPQSIPGVAVTTIDASDGPTAADLTPVEAASDDPGLAPRIIPRRGWGANESLRFRNGVELWPPLYATVEHAVIHHSEDNITTDPAVAMRSIYAYHAVTRGWGDIAYNYLIDRFGNIYEGRTGGQNVVGGHTTLFNVGSAGVCVIGDFRSQAVSTAIRSSLVNVIAWLLRGRDPLATSDFWYLTNVPAIVSHQQLVPTTCPGTNLQSLLPAIRSGVQTAMQQSPGTAPAGLVPGDTVVVSAPENTSVNLRTTAGLNGAVIAALSAGVTGMVLSGPLIADNLPWFEISTTFGNGWSTAEYLELAPAGTPGGGLFKIGDTLAVTANSLSLMAMPTSSASVLYGMSLNELAYVVNGPKYAEGTIWYQVNDAPGNNARKTGWASQLRFRLVSDVPFGPPQPLGPGDAVRTTTSLNLRAGPLTSAAVIATMRSGAVAQILAGPVSGSGMQWFELQTANQRGFAAAQYLARSNFAPPATATPTRTPTATATPQATATLTDAELTATNTPTVTNTASSTPLPTTTPTQTATSVSTPTNPPAGVYVPGDVVATTATINFRSSPSTSGGVLSVLSTGTLATVAGGPVSASGHSWWQAVVGTTSGWLAGQYLRRVTSPPPTVVGSQFSIGQSIRTVRSTNLRSGPSTSASIVALLPGSAAGTIASGPELADNYTWWRAGFAQGTGWVAESNIAALAGPSPTVVPPLYQPGTELRTTTSLRMRSAPSTSAALVTTLTAGAIVRVIEGPTSASGHLWWRVEAGGISGWCSGSYLRPA